MGNTLIKHIHPSELMSLLYPLVFTWSRSPTCPHTMFFLSLVRTQSCFTTRKILRSFGFRQNGEPTAFHHHATIAHPRQAGTPSHQERNRLPAVFAPAPRAKPHFSDMGEQLLSPLKAGHEALDRPREKAPAAGEPQGSGLWQPWSFPTAPKVRGEGVSQCSLLSAWRGPWVHT